MSAQTPSNHVSLCPSCVIAPAEAVIIAAVIASAANLLANFFIQRLSSVRSTVKIRFACKTQPHGRFFIEKSQAIGPPQRPPPCGGIQSAVHCAAQKVRALPAARTKPCKDSSRTFCSPPQPPWALPLCDFLVALRAASFGYRSVVSPEPHFVYRGLLLILLPHCGRKRIVAYGLKSPINFT